MMRRILKWTLPIIGVAFIGLQFTNPARTNPPFDEWQTLESVMAAPAEVLAIFGHSCNDCQVTRLIGDGTHTLRPSHLLAVGHVNDGRKELNFSVCSSYRPDQLRA